MRKQLKAEPIYLDAARRDCVQRTIEEVAAHRGWVLHALNVRTNHVHLVVSAACAPEKAMSDFKAWTTRRLREAKLLDEMVRLWAEHGRTLYLNDTNSLDVLLRVRRTGADLSIR